MKEVEMYSELFAEPNQPTNVLQLKCPKCNNFIIQTNKLPVEIEEPYGNGTYIYCKCQNCNEDIKIHYYGKISKTELYF